MNTLKPTIYILFLLSTLFLSGQISPGDLSNAHADLEGISNCTQCHELGNKVIDRKCLQCHKEIQSLVNKKKGFHGNPTIVKQDCAECHGEHNGRKFDMVRFDHDAFDHNLTGYKLEGKHVTVDCRKCHISENIQDREIKKRKNTFLGLEAECLSCHDDFHQGTLAEDCRQCHDMNGFKPAPLFDHNETEFALKGEHQYVDCIDCHGITTRNGREFQEFSGIAFDDCISCHEDPHNAQLQGQCAQCHTETSFNDFVGQGNFDHNSTGFELRGGHEEISCFNCHDTTSDPIEVFQDRRRVSENSCVSCHNDVHDGQYGNDCARCHRETSFLSLKNMDFFDHSVTDYPLEGKHIGVDCRKCHNKRFSTPIDFTACNNCHSDYHRGEFTENGITPDCVECHSLEKGFDYSLFTLEQHQETNFPLKGAHTATPCFACHVDERSERWTFKDMQTACVDCHMDIHEGHIDAKYYPKDDCRYCHSNEAWNQVTFDHRNTNWPLDGKHLEVDCRDCHFIENSANSGEVVQQFANLDTDCKSCHKNVHGRVFEIEGVTDCTRCHVTDSWYPKRFNHDLTNFPLEGQHNKIACSSCHEVTNAEGQTETLYKLGKFRCIDCHLQ